MSGTIALSEISALDHELLNDAVEGRTLVSKALLTSCKGTAELVSDLL